MKRSLILFALLITLLASDALAQSGKITFQGVLRDSDGRSVADGNYSLTFKFYDAATGGNLVPEVFPRLRQKEKRHLR